MTIYNVYDQVASLIASLPPAQVMSLRPSPEVARRFEALVEKSKAVALSREEKDELDHFIVLERLIRLAKIRTQNVDS